MVTAFEASIAGISVHRVGNRSQDEFYSLSEKPLQIEDDLLKSLLIQFFLSPFSKENEVYRFIHSGGDLDLNEMFNYSSRIFGQPDDFHELSGQITRHLFDVSVHPKIKPGEVYICRFSNLQLEGELSEAIGIFKSETKETYLKVEPGKEGYSVTYEQNGINIQRLDKGCLIFNSERNQGYKVMVIDQTNRTDTAYWKDDFLKIGIRNDSFSKTNNALRLCKNFINDRIDESFDISGADKADLLNRSLKYFREKENFDINGYSEEVIGNPKASELFRNYSREFNDNSDTEIDSGFAISPAAVKKQSRIFKSVLKLDKNFHIYIHGNREMIEKGYDDERGMNFYKVLFKEEA